ncbi:hypothetical protein [uncultured Microbacterium sp.]|uniref:hypothetical protein n=1 Tax=uncultured Microbacterium sp. TaxID=191216 RepID=UPI0025D6EF56|nr:hypothetical protein [uncultured Microbacterium sp.]
MNPERRRAGRRIRRDRRIAARFDAMCANLGIEPMPWQRDLALAALRGEIPTTSRARRAGWSTVHRLIDTARGRHG